MKIAVSLLRLLALTPSTSRVNVVTVIHDARRYEIENALQILDILLNANSGFQNVCVGQKW